MQLPHWLRALGRALIDPIEQNVCIVRVAGVAALVPWAAGAWHTATTMHPHLRAIGESGGGIVSALGLALSAKRWSQGNNSTGVVRKGPPGTDIEDHP